MYTAKILHRRESDRLMNERQSKKSIVRRIAQTPEQQQSEFNQKGTPQSNKPSSTSPIVVIIDNIVPSAGTFSNAPSA